MTHTSYFGGFDKQDGKACWLGLLCSRTAMWTLNAVTLYLCCVVFTICKAVTYENTDKDQSSNGGCHWLTPIKGRSLVRYQGQRGLYIGGL